ncbi:MAG: CsbD family protein [Actinobacteria bacterium]|nr:CsbD family protein [Actinomycetota bacterium]
MGESSVKSGLKGIGEDVKGKAKEFVGEISGKEELENEGRAQQDKAKREREVAEHEAKAEAARAEEKTDEARQRAAERSK